MSPFEVAVIVTTFERPGHVRRALESISFQQDVAGKFEVVVVDDGSRDETSQVVAEFARGQISRSDSRPIRTTASAWRSRATREWLHRVRPICCSSTATVCCLPTTFAFTSSCAGAATPWPATVAA